jgi:hypothetical protein
MRILMNVSFPVEQFSTQLHDGSANKRICSARGDQAESVYFTEHEGQRGR